MSNLLQAVNQLENQAAKPRRSVKHGGKRTGAGRPKKSVDELIAAGAQRSKVRAILSPESEPEQIAEPILPGFLATVADERNTFAQRMTHGTTLCLDQDGATYHWPEGDAATDALAYAKKVVGKELVTGRLVQKAAQRFLDDLANGASKGFFFDPWAARNIATWFQQHCRLKLLDWEKFIVTQLFGFKRASGLRRFTELWLSVARKNGKSSLLGGIGLFCLICDGEEKAEIYSAATTRDQARIVWRAAKYAAEQNPELKAFVRIMERSLVVKSTFSFFQPLSSDASTLDGLNIACAMADEIHEHPSRDLTDRLTGGMAGRKQPLLLSATTAGESRECFAFSRNEYFERVLEGIIVADNSLIFIAELDAEDDYRDASLWVKANPSIDVLVRRDFLQTQLKEIENQPTKLNSWLRFHANRWVEKVAGHSLPYDRIEACGTVTSLNPLELRKQFLENFWHKEYYAGYDHGETDDMSALVQVFPDVVLPGSDVRRCVVIPHFWMPEQYVMQREREWGVPVSDWVRRGYIRLCPGDLNDMVLIGQDILKLFSENRPQDCGFDRYGGIRQAMAALIDLQFKCTEVPQTALHLTEASKFFKNAVLKGELVTLNHPVLKWNLANAQLECDERNGLMKPAKASGDTRRKIDGVQAAVTALARFLDPEGKPIKSIYSERGILHI
jgi:phage terminase large subunit-like protein